MSVHLPNRVIRFPRNERKIYAHKPAPKALPPSGCKPPITRNPQDEDDDPPTPTMFAQTVEENKLFYTPREVDRAKQAQDLLAALRGSPSVADLKAAVAMNAIANLPVTTKDINLAEKIFGKDIGTLKGKSTRTKPPPVVSDAIEIPPELCDARDTWELAMDIMFVNNVPYMTSITKALHYRTATPMPGVKDPQIFDAIDRVFRLYNDALRHDASWRVGSGEWTRS